MGAIALANGWLSGDWLVIIALALTMTFIAAAPPNARARSILAGVESVWNFDIEAGIGLAEALI